MAKSNSKTVSRGEDILAYNEALLPSFKAIAVLLCNTINNELPNAENKIWHGHPVWFLDGNPVVGYSKLKDSIWLLF